MKTELKNFLEIVQIDSPSGHEKLMAMYVVSWLEKHGFEVFRDETGNVLGTLNGEGKPFLLCAHMDTVEPGRSIQPQVLDGKIKSSGDTILGADNKVAIAAILTSVEAYLHQTKKPRSLELLFTVKEETGGGIEHFPSEKLKAKHGFIFDFAHPLGGIILSAPEIVNFLITFTGKAAHARQPEKGKSVLPAVEKFLAATSCGRLDDDQTTLNIGKLELGTGANTVPASANIYGEVRSVSNQLFQKHLHMLERNAKEIAQQLQLEVSWATDGYCPGYVFAPDHPLVVWTGELLTKLGHTVDLQKQYGVSDANILNDWGIQTLTLADGVVAPHTVNESISIESLQNLTKIVDSLLNTFPSNIANSSLNT